MTAGWIEGKRAILVLTGTDVHPFRRICDWADRWARAHPDDDVLVQHGFTSAPRIARAVDLLTPAELSAALQGADIVVTHGGPGTISTVRAAGLLPAVFPRDPKFGEHVDEHQMRFAIWAGERGLGRIALDAEQLDSVILDVAKQDDAAGTPTLQIGVSVATLGTRMEDLARGKRFRRAFPLVRRPRWAPAVPEGSDRTSDPSA